MFKTYSQFTKFGIVIFVLLAGAAGYATGFLIETSFHFLHLITFILGLYCLSSGSLALNQVQEYKLDQKMHRTKNRPVASGILSRKTGLLISLPMIFIGIGILFYQSITAGIVAVISVIFYNLIYTMYLKRKWVFAAVPGAIPGALPVTIGYAVNNAEIFNSESIYLFLVMFLWQMPHFWTLALKYKDDYAAGGIPTLPVAGGVQKTLFHIGLYTFTYAGVALASPFFLHASWVFILCVFPFAVMLLKEFFVFYHSENNKKWLPFFMWVNISLIIFLYVPVIDKWSFLFLDRV